MNNNNKKCSEWLDMKTTPLRAWFCCNILWPFRGCPLEVCTYFDSHIDAFEAAPEGIPEALWCNPLPELERSVCHKCAWCCPFHEKLQIELRKLHKERELVERVERRRQELRYVEELERETLSAKGVLTTNEVELTAKNPEVKEVKWNEEVRYCPKGIGFCSRGPFVCITLGGRL